MSKASKITLSVVAVIYIILCFLSGIPTTLFFNHDLTFNEELNQDRAKLWRLSVYEDAIIEPNVLNLPNGKMVLGNPFLVIGRYRKFTIPFVPGVITANKYSFKIDSDWQRIKLRFDVIESPDLVSNLTYTDICYQIKILENPVDYCYLIHSDTPYLIDVTEDRYKQYHGYVVYASNKEKINGTDFVITVSWDKALKDWGSEEKVWYPGYKDPCEVNK